MSILPLKEFTVEGEDKNINKQLKIVLIGYNADHLEIKQCPKDLREGSLNKQWRGRSDKAEAGPEEQG